MIHGAGKKISFKFTIVGVRVGFFCLFVFMIIWVI